MRSSKKIRNLVSVVPALAIILFSFCLPIAASEPEQKVPFRSWTALRAKDVVLQKLDFSCGAASIATLSTYFLGKPTTEEEVLRIIRARYTPADWKKKKNDGLSLEDLAFMAEQLGFKAQGAIVGLSALLKLSGPVIVHLNKGEFQHFTVLRGIHGMTVYLADPVFGRVPMSLGSFVDQFTGAILAVWDPSDHVPSDFALKLKEEDKFYGRLSDTLRPSFYDRPQSLGFHFF